MKAFLTMSVLAVVTSMSVTTTFASIIIGAPATGGNFIPFGGIAGFPEYQQVYASSDFSGTIKIDDIEFYTFAGSGSPNTGRSQYRFQRPRLPLTGSA